ncbi:glycosyltransferase family 2 protein [Portibacter marinus]|uniref:glycosyltransferase family 2 protein n=1 Tax=Portibacter marinus TaxID=2898660 RepID=UPI001F3CFC7A|nr:glycosyltransferase family 2 protein [Portibacter marinus]
MTKKYSIIVCTRNRSEILEICLNELYQYYPDKQSDFEILVIDNGSVDNTRSVIDHFNQIKYYFEGTVGLSAARNRGIKEANSEWIIFLDDDCKIDSKFYIEIRKIADLQIYEAFTGIFKPWYRQRKPDWIPDSFGRKKIFATEIQDLGRDYVSGGIMGFKKNLFNQTGLFPLHLGMKDSKIGYGEETYIIEKLKNLKVRIGINPNLIIYHLVRSEKLTLQWHLRSQFAHHRDSYIIKGGKGYVYLVAYPIILLIPNLFLRGIKFSTDPLYKWQNFVFEMLEPFYASAGAIKGKLSQNDHFS